MNYRRSFPTYNSEAASTIWTRYVRALRFVKCQGVQDLHGTPSRRPSVDLSWRARVMGERAQTGIGELNPRMWQNTGSDSMSR